MNVISLSAQDLSIAAVLVLALAGFSFRMRLGLGGQILVAAIRTTVQLLLVGLVLRIVFASNEPIWIFLAGSIMILAAGREVMARQSRGLKGWSGFGIGVGSIFLSSVAVLLLTLIAIVQADPWYTPRYAIPLLGMLAGNTMTGIALSMNTLTLAVWQNRVIIEQRLLLGQDRVQAIADLRSEGMRAGMIPSINAMATAGIVSLPGMMTGQILAGSPVLEAVKYQILIMFTITATTGFGILLALRFVAWRLFDERHRLHLEYLAPMK